MKKLLGIGVVVWAIWKDNVDLLCTDMKRLATVFRNKKSYVSIAWSRHQNFSLTRKPRGVITVPELMGGGVFTFYTSHVLWCEYFRINSYNQPDVRNTAYYHFFSPCQIDLSKFCQPVTLSGLLILTQPWFPHGWAGTIVGLRTVPNGMPRERHTTAPAFLWSKQA